MRENVRRILIRAGDVVAGVVLIFLFLNPRRELAPIFVLLAGSVLLAWVLPRLFRAKSRRQETQADKEEDVT
jgi:hypothetical protein